MIIIPPPLLSPMRLRGGGLSKAQLDEIDREVNREMMLMMGAMFGPLILGGAALAGWAAYEHHTNPRGDLNEMFKAQAVQVIAKKGDKKVQMEFPVVPLRVEKDSKGADVTYTTQPYATGWFEQNQLCSGTYQHKRYYQHTGKYRGWKTSTTEPIARVCTPMFEAAKDPAKQELLTAMRGYYAKLWPGAKLAP